MVRAALREGLHLLGAAGIDVRHETAVLLPALYIALVAGKYEELGQAGERAVAWALGLAEDSPLIPVTDVLLTAPGTAGTWRQPGEAGGRAASVWWPWFLVMDLHVAPVMG